MKEMNLCKYVGILTVCAALVNCSSEQLPNDTKVRISPGAKNLEIGSVFEEGMFCFTEGGLYQDVPLLITVSDGQDTPLGEAEVGVYADYSGNTSNGAEVLQLYQDVNGNGVIDGPDELVTSNTSGVYNAKTDKYNGSTSLMLRMFLTCPYKGEIYVFAGTSSTSMDVGVSYLKKQTTTETNDGESTESGETDSADAGTTGVGILDAGSADAGTTGVGILDAGSVDAGLADVGLLDAGSVDAGSAAGGSGTNSLDGGSANE